MIAAVSVPSGTRVLIVEDHVESARGLGRLLGVFGYEVAIATNGLDAITTAETFAPAAALIDLTLPGLDGFDVARHLRALSATRASRLIAMTGWSTDDYAERGRAAGFDAHLVKPISVETLIHALSPASSPDEARAPRSDVRRRPPRTNRVEMR